MYSPKKFNILHKLHGERSRGDIDQIGLEDKELLLGHRPEQHDLALGEGELKEHRNGKPPLEDGEDALSSGQGLGPF